ncbi:MAG TPA: hypothetical protein VK581_05280 [Chthoniobacterales bacterium]|nr:hypothetical protein [Chthoniobacterales bacterium]
MSELLGDVEMPLGINFEQQMRSGRSVPDGGIRQEPVHIVIETKVDAGINSDQLIEHCETFVKGREGNYLMLLTKNEADEQFLNSIRIKAKETGIVFRNVTFEKLCDSLKGLAREYETHLARVIEDYADYCIEMGLLPDRRKWLRIVPCGSTLDLNTKWNLYYQPTDRGYSAHEYIGIYNQKAVRFLARVAAIYCNETDAAGQMKLTLVTGIDRPAFHQRIKGMVADSKKKLGWDLTSDTRFFCADQLVPTDFRKTSWGGIQGARFWDISDQVGKAGSDAELADLLRHEEWE